MKVTCLLTSYNRPNWVRHALKSVADQTHKDYQLIVLDDSNLFDIKAVVSQFSFSQVKVFKLDVSRKERTKKNRLSVNLNLGLRHVEGDLVCCLCDDDYYYPKWFENAVAHFTAHQDHHVAFGMLAYSSSREMVYPKDPKGKDLLFLDGPVGDPACRIDHNQVIHRRFGSAYQWPEDVSTLSAPDSIYFTKLARDHVFHPIRSFAVVKRRHSKCLQKNVDRIRAGKAEDLRE